MGLLKNGELLSKSVKPELVTSTQRETAKKQWRRDGKLVGNEWVF